MNLFDIVRLYETRQSGRAKLSPATISEAQLIGRGARYCPFQIDDEQPKFKRKYDDDITNELRICEELFYHCQNDHRYVTELHQALREIGLDTDKVKHCEYILKESFMKEQIYKDGVIFINDRKVKSRNEITGLLPTVRDAIYQYKALSGVTGTERLMIDYDPMRLEINNPRTVHMTIGEIAQVNYAIVHKAMRRFPIFKFNTLQSYFPNVKSTRQFIFDEAYLGKVKIDIQCLDETPPVNVMYNAVVDVLGKIAESISAIEETYYGTNEFNAVKINRVFRNKTVKYTDLHDGGKGMSQAE